MGQQSAAVRNNLEASGLSYCCNATKQGGVPVIVEKRKHNKVVVVFNVEGETSCLLSDLQRCLGTGGVLRKKGEARREKGHEGSSYRTDQIEVTGEKHEKKVREFLVSQGCIVGASGKVKKEVERATAKNKKRGMTGKEHAEKKLEIERTKKAEKQAAFDPVLVQLDTKKVKGMRPADLKGHLAARKCSTQGSKKELVARLLKEVANPGSQQAVQQGAAIEISGEGCSGGGGGDGKDDMDSKEEGGGGGESEVRVLEARLVRFYTKYAEEKVSEASNMLIKFAGKEEKLFKALVEKYGPEPPLEEQDDESDEIDAGAL